MYFISPPYTTIQPFQHEIRVFPRPVRYCMAVFPAHLPELACTARSCTCPRGLATSKCSGATRGQRPLGQVTEVREGSRESILGERTHGKPGKQARRGLLGKLRRRASGRSPLVLTGLTSLQYWLIPVKMSSQIPRVYLTQYSSQTVVSPPSRSRGSPAIHTPPPHQPASLRPEPLASCACGNARSTRVWLSVAHVSV